MRVVFLTILLVISGAAYFIVSGQLSNVKKKIEKDEVGRRTMEYDAKKFFFSVLRWIAIGGLALFAILFVANCGIIIDTGKVGVKVFFGSVRDGYIPEGFHLKNPFYNIRQTSIQLQIMEADAAADIVTLSKDQLEMQIDATQPFRVMPSAAAWLYQNVGDDFYNQVLLPAARTSTRQAVSRFNAQELVSTKRDSLAIVLNQYMIMAVDSILSEFTTSLLQKPNMVFDFPRALVRNIALPEKLKDAIELKLTNQQEAEAMAYKLQKERQEAERKKIEAQGIQAFQTIVTQGITENLLKWKGIEATEKLAASPNTKFVIMSSDKLPVILSTEESKK